jgi:predicted aspartyl protease
LQSQVEGYFDETNRPRISIRVAGFSETIEAVIDTGFDGALKISLDQAVKANLDIVDAQFFARVASGQKVKFYLADGEVFWFGTKMAKVFLVSLPEVSHEFSPKRSDSETRSEQIILLGNELLQNTILRVDYCARTVTVVPC